MFGITAFAQAPIAALGGNSYAVSLAESFTLTDAVTGPAAFQGLIADSISITDDVPNRFDFYLSTAESFNIDTQQNNISVYPDIIIKLKQIV